MPSAPAHSRRPLRLQPRGCSRASSARAAQRRAEGWWRRREGWWQCPRGQPARDPPRRCRPRRLPRARGRGRAPRAPRAPASSRRRFLRAAPLAQRGALGRGARSGGRHPGWCGRVRCATRRQRRLAARHLSAPRGGRGGTAGHGDGVLPLEPRPRLRASRGQRRARAVARCGRACERSRCPCSRRQLAARRFSAQRGRRGGAAVCRSAAVRGGAAVRGARVLPLEPRPRLQASLRGRPQARLGARGGRASGRRGRAHRRRGGVLWAQPSPGWRASRRRGRARSSARSGCSAGRSRRARHDCRFPAGRRSAPLGGRGVSAARPGAIISPEPSPGLRATRGRRCARSSTRSGCAGGRARRAPQQRSLSRHLPRPHSARGGCRAVHGGGGQLRSHAVPRCQPGPCLRA